MYVVRRKRGEGVRVQVGDVVFYIKYDDNRLVFSAGQEVSIKRQSLPGDEAVEDPLGRACSQLEGVNVGLKGEGPFFYPHPKSELASCTCPACKQERKMLGIPEPEESKV